MYLRPRSSSSRASLPRRSESSQSVTVANIPKCAKTIRANAAANGPESPWVNGELRWRSLVVNNLPGYIISQVFFGDDLQVFRLHAGQVRHSVAREFEPSR